MASLLGGAILDYGLAGCLSIHTEWAGLWRPHALLTLAFKLDVLPNPHISTSTTNS